MAESYEPRKVRQCEQLFFNLLTVVPEQRQPISLYLASLFRNGSRGVQCILLLTGVTGHPGDGLLNQEAEVPSGSGLQL